MGSGPTARRRHRRRLLEISFVVGSFVAAGLVAAGVVAGADQPSIASDRSDYAPGNPVALSGSGWVADETVHVVVDHDQGDAWSHEADVVAAADGTVSDSFDLPELAGTFAVTATATSGSASASFTVTAPTPPPPAPTGTPSLDSDEETYTPGATVTLTGSDWQAGDTVHVAVNDDGSDAWDHSADVTVAADGTITDTFDLPDGLAADFIATANDPANRSATATFSAGFGSATEPYLVRFASGTSTETQAQILTAAGAVDTNYIAPLRIHAALLPGGAGLQTSLDKLRSYASVTRVEPDRTREAGGTPNDANYGDQWSLTKIGWENVFGSVSPSGSAKVAILDTGIDGLHPDLDGNVVSGTSILDGSNGLSDPNGHGTAMAGIVAAETNNGAGIAGVGYAGVQVMPVTVLGADGTGQDSEIIEGVVYAAEHDADVILMAFSNPGYSEMLQAAIDYAWDEGAVLVAATGNDGSSSPQFPAGDRGVIGVSNTDQNDALNSSSNYGPDVFLGAPGTAIATTSAGGGYTTLTGTSASAAEVAGAAALIRANSGAANGVIVSRLAKNAEAVGTRDQTGNGRLNLDRAVSDTSTGAIQPAGAAPVGGGGPFVGPYVSAARNWVLTFAGAGSGSVTITPNTGTINAPVSCGGTGTNASTQTVTATCSPNITTSDNGATITFNASANAGSTFAGWSDPASASSNTCVGTTNPCSLVFGSGGALTVTFNAGQRPTTTGVTCAPGSVALGEGSVCTATVTDNGSGTKSDPSGTVTFSSSGSGAFTLPGATCTLVSDGNALTFTSSCSATYTPSAIGTGTHTITGTYDEASSATHASSSGTFALTVTKRSTSTTVTCSPASVAFGQASTCTTVVADTDSGTKSFPTGTVTLSATPAASGTFSSTTCSLAQVGSTTTSSCDVTYTPSANAGTHTINASYGGSTTHAVSSDPDGFALTVTKRDTATTVTCTPGTVAIDQASSCDAQVDDVEAGGTKSNPSGTVSFTRTGPGGGTFTGTCTLAPVAADPDSSHCTSPVSYTPTSGAGTHVITGHYNGSAVHEESEDDFNLTVTKRDTATTVTCTPGTVAIDQASSCDAQVDDVEAGGTKSNPSGTVSFTRTGPGGGTFTGTCTLAPVAADPDSSHCTSPVSYTPTSGAGTHVITGHYNGSAVHEESEDDFNLTVTKRDTATTVTCTPGTVAIDQASSCDAQVDDVEAGGTKSNPSGTVSFTRTGPGGGTFTGTCTLAPVAADPDSSHCTSPVSYTPTSGAGTHVITGHYNGSAVHEESEDDFNLTVTKRDTATTVTCTPGTVAIDQASSCDAQVDDVEAGGTKSNPSGTVSFTRTGPGGGTFTGTCTLAPVAADPDSSHCTSPVSYTPTSGAGTHVITGHYNGSAVHEESEDDFNLTVTKRDTATTVTCTPGTVAIDQASSCDAQVDDVEAGGTKSNPSGTVSFTRTGPGGGTFTGTCTLAPVAADPDSSHCTSPVSYTPTSGAGTHVITGHYNGSAVHEESEDDFNLTVTKRDTATTVTCTPGTVAIDQASSCDAQVDDVEAGGTKSNPSGTVSFTRTGPGGGTFTGTCTLAPVAADPDSSHCTSPVSYTPTSGAGTHVITGHYNGSAVHEESEDDFNLTVTKRDTATTVTCTPGTVAIDQASSCDAQVDDVEAGGTKSNPSGTVSFTRTGPGGGTFTGTCTLAPVAADPDSSHCTSPVSYTPTSGAGTHVITGHYNGSAVHEESEDDFNLTVTKRDTATTVTCTPNSVVVNQSTTCTATVSDEDAGGKSWPQGTVSFGNGSASGTFTGSPCVLAQVGATPTSSCTVTYTPTGAGSGTHTVTGSYSGSPVHEVSSGTATVSVSKRTTTTSVTCNPLLTQVGTNSTCTATVTDTHAAGTGTPPTGTVTFTFVNSTTGTTTQSCTSPLSPSGARASSCSVTYSSSVPAVVTVTAAYGGSDVHLASNSNAEPVFVVFYDPNGGFVTGGGWIVAPTGSCTGAGTTYSCSPLLTGKANFGFVSKYKKGATVPEGNTEFQFHAAGLNFKSTAFEWLVVAGSKAQFKGSGTINGTGNYTFQLFANDNSPGTDEFRIKIWETVSGLMIFDNKIDQGIAGGSIVVHKA